MTQFFLVLLSFLHVNRIQKLFVCRLKRIEGDLFLSTRALEMRKENFKNNIWRHK